MSLINSQRQKPKQSSCFDDGQCESSNVGHPQFDDDDPRSIRKYLVLLQDCLAIKFVPIVANSPSHSSSAHHHHQSFSFPFNNNASINNNMSMDGRSSSNCYNSFDNINRNNSSCSNRHSNYNVDHQQFRGFAKSNSLSSSARKNGHLMTSKAAAASLLTESSGSSTDEVDHSLNGLHLYKNFREANLKCYWNTTLYEAFHSLEYKGYILPSTLLIWAIPRYLTTLRTAWSRQILRSPPGFHIAFMGEIEELLADPIQQSQFAPLSDSLCWAILEITSMGQEAFLDSILIALTSAFPTMVLPAKELIYATLEKLIKERKVYQTSHGYFVVTPDTFRYMISSGNPQPTTNTNTNNNAVNHDFHNASATMPLDALLSSPTQQHHDPDPISFSRNSWDSEGSTKNHDVDGNSSEEREPQLRRHNSMKIIRQRDSSFDTTTNQDFIKDKTRSMSFRLYKSKSIPNALKDEKQKSSTMSRVGKLTKQMETLLRKDAKNANTVDGNSEPAKTKTGKPSFFRKLFKRSTIKKSDKSVEDKTASIASASTQTPPSYENGLNKHSEPELKSQQSSNTTPIIPKINASPPRHFALANDLLNDEPNPTTPFNSRCNSLPRRPGSRLSMSILNDEHHLYSTPTSGNNNGGPNNSSIRYPSGGGSSSRCSTLSQGTSLGYGSQGPTSLGFMSHNSHSPSPSMSPSGIYSTLNHHPSSSSTPIKSTQQPLNGNNSNLLLPSRSSRSYGSYRNYNDYYRRRYPPYGSTTFQNSQPSSSSAATTTTGHSAALFSNNKTIKSPQQSASDGSNKTTIQESSTQLNNGNVISTTRNLPFMTTTTTTVTQNVKSTTNMELEFSLPLRKSTSSMMTAVPVVGRKPAAQSSGPGPTNKMNVNLSSCTPAASQCTTKFIIGQPKSETTEVKTTINHNGTIETHFDCDPNQQTTVGNEPDDVKKSCVEIKLGSSSAEADDYPKTNGLVMMTGKSNHGEKEKVNNCTGKNGYKLGATVLGSKFTPPTIGCGIIKKRPSLPLNGNGFGGYNNNAVKVSGLLKETEFV